MRLKAFYSSLYESKKKNTGDYVLLSTTETLILCIIMIKRYLFITSKKISIVISHQKGDY